MRVDEVIKADLLSDNFRSKQSTESFALPLTCHSSPIVLPPMLSGRVK